ncbi:MAG: hypothetical protein WCI05_14995 [Myxococcales bacterium]
MAVSILLIAVVAIVVVALGTVAVVFLARTQARQEGPPPSKPGDFFAPVSSGGYRFRKTDESLDEFHARVAKENAELERQRGR